MTTDPLPPSPGAAAPGTWSGQPVTGLVGADLRAGLLAGVATAVVLGAGLPTLDHAPLEQALVLAGGYAALVAVSVTLARAAGAGRVLVLQTAFLDALAAAAVLTSSPWLVPPAVLALLNALMLVARWRQRRRTRYEVAGRRVTIARPGYTVVFDVTTPPRAVPDRFGGSLGDVDFGPVDAKLIARTGAVFKVVGRRQPLERIREASRVADLLGAAVRPA